MGTLPHWPRSLKPDFAPGQGIFGRGGLERFRGLADSRRVTVQLTEKYLSSIGGWQAYSLARSLVRAGAVSEVTYQPPVLKGKIRQGEKFFFSGLSIKSPSDVENLCPCRDSRVRGMICEHALAVGVAYLNPPARTQEKPVAPARVPSPAAGPPQATTLEKPEVVIALEGSLRHLDATVDFRYSRPGVCNPEAEGRVISGLLAAGFEDSGGKASLKGEDSILRFLARDLPEWKSKYKVNTGERFEHVTRDVVTIEPCFAIKDRGDGWLDFHVHFTAGKEAVFSAGEIQKLLQSGTPHVKLKDGRRAVANGVLSADLEEVLRDCNPRQERGTYRIPANQKGYLEASLQSWGCPTPSLSTQTTASELGILKTQLRPYQVQGALWMLELAKANLGGILADEMGLGKTVQTLALIEVLNRPVLVTCPSSLVWNWKSEAARFLPGLPVLTLEGPDRFSRFADIPAHRLIVTSYGTLRNDVERYRKIQFAAVILDEAQHIKNPDSKNAQAACALNADSRFILTGTPVENSLRDLWSLFEFAMPGYLGTRKDFKERYEDPLKDGSVGEVWKRLSRRISPHVLRRKKAEILTELPEKIEQVLEVELNDEQKAAYTQLQIAARARIDELRRNSGGGARMQALTALLRLRQACCDLRLLGAGNFSPSSKRLALMELLQETIDGGHRTLVFSQFTAVLDLLAGDLQEREIRFLRLDGSTRDRAGVVEEFQNTDSIPVFLISLKAGGTGLNLTAADTVIHFDPWWNPAAEAQASDRVHRIGQKRSVNIIKLICRDTVEDKVLRMQAAKREMLEATLDSGNPSPQFTPEDLADLV